MPGKPPVRASDHEREQVARSLGEHAAAGRLTLEELAERVEQAYAARTRTELGEVTRDLPGGTRPGSRRATRFVLSLLGGSDRKGRWRVGKRLAVLAALGSSNLDLREAEIDGDEVTITAVALMGGIDVYVPEAIEVVVSELAVMGSNEQRGSQASGLPGAPRIRVRACSLMAGVRIWRLPAETRGKSLRQARRAAKALER